MQTRVAANLRSACGRKQQQQGHGGTRAYVVIIANINATRARARNKTDTRRPETSTRVRSTPMQKTI